MTLSLDQQELLRTLPAVDRMIELARAEACFELIPASVVVAAIREVIEADRRRILGGERVPAPAELAETAVLQRVKAAVAAAMRPRLRRVVNATGVVLHTNLGRALLAEEAVANLVGIAGRYSNLEYDLDEGAPRLALHGRARPAARAHRRRGRHGRQQQRRGGA